MEFLDKEINKNYFEWIKMEKDFLEKLLTALKTSQNLEKIGAEIYQKSISFSKLSILLDKFSYNFSDRTLLQKNQNILAYGYLKKRLPEEIKTLKLSIHNNPSLVAKKDIEIIDEMLLWLSHFIDAILYNKKVPEINGRIDKFTQFVNNKKGVFFEDKNVKNNFLKTNKELYDCATEAVKLFEQKEYFYFVLIYLEMIALFLKMVTLLSGMFLETELLSIYIDPITLLPNRFQLIKDLNTITNCYLLIINAKNFSKLNVLYGFETGDIILKKIAAFLKTTNAIKSYRIYGDEFAILLHTKEDLIQLFDQINKSISITIDGIKHDIMFYAAFDKFEQKSLESCEFALTKSDKKSLVDTSSVKEMISSYKKELSMAQKLKEAMIKDNIIPYFQPIYVTKPSNKILKYEVLMRVKYNDEILMPKDFLDTLKEMPFYTEFTKSVLLKSFETFKNTPYTFSVNFTLSDIKDKNLLLFLKVLLEKYPEVSKRFTIEITEAEALKEFELLNDFINEFKSYGITFSLDDFGSGYSNFAQVANLDIDFIKIDGSIIKEILNSDKMKKLLDSIVNFAKSFNLKVIAEFVSSKELFEYLKDKVDMLQGYYIGKPEPFLLE
ncbi:EAL domain-containing protein [Caminibacter pacificus]|jgi:EAL domain-containing protein (putative c-di-GMP-specific phosphodiesterase class I)/GGDEF domain-containing protein